MMDFFGALANQGETSSPDILLRMIFFEGTRPNILKSFMPHIDHFIKNAVHGDVASTIILARIVVYH